MSNKIISTGRRRRAVEWYSRVFKAAKAYWMAIPIVSGLLFISVLIFSGTIPTKLELGPLALVLVPVLAWLGLAGMAIIVALAVPRFVAPLGIDIEGKEDEWVIWVLALTLLATLPYSLLFPNFWAVVALGLWYVAAFLFFNEATAEGIIALLFQ